MQEQPRSWKPQGAGVTPRPVASDVPVASDGSNGATAFSVPKELQVPPKKKEKKIPTFFSMDVTPYYD